MTGKHTQDEPADIRIVSRNVTPEEAAAVTAVVRAALLESAELAGADETAPITAWARSQRPIRQPLTPGPGAWKASARR
ncbi:acyl-CoA carboxylase subunit epsilon [Salinibacterium sp. NSLL150]|uniref:acyl-CoA carboxylase subunit epsilon n=1 Tax=unclassified Salinibacterium TaxID=2632331 RepID=UPI0018CCC023|nr:MULTISPECIES: acyl-CoA carboxylase subunit epsilon [unclassified Salinibacterium]MBH0098493.1 acyl-CoA carboxylase subunit epsilon [Salinibacterium sp. NSLL35]MBH0101248.1 acyl-CoA carboxylase subunit epsilon [Salinibacterium sp. NSLL150]MBH0104007.1 acyl-CoA carboxylase subunit epsilon [Salinibacterium sp. NSLL16]MBH0106768.1 acyl-CoA carboxylase subunit epsilon [Salinibacterium sp. NSLL17]MBH0109460.1 acyl-CoA carboxylase subunit epsilon [Salinibacterium sp. NG22]